MRPIFQLSICCDSSGPATEPRKEEGVGRAGEEEKEGKGIVVEKERNLEREAWGRELCKWHPVGAQGLFGK